MTRPIIFSEIIPKEQALDNGVLDKLNLTSGSKNLVTCKNYYFYTVRFKGTELLLIYGGLACITNNILISNIMEKFRTYSPYNIPAYYDVKLLQAYGLCNILKVDKLETTCGHKAQLPVYTNKGEILCPKCFNKVAENYIIGKSCKLLYRIPF